MHLRSHGLAMAAACPLSPRDCRVSHSSFSLQKGARERPLRGHYAPSIRTSAEPALGHTRQSKRLTSRKCKLRGGPRVIRVPFGTGPSCVPKRRARTSKTGIKVRLHHTNTTKAVPMLSASTPRSVFEVRLHHSVTT